MVMNRGAIEEFTTFLETLRNELETARTRFIEVESLVARLETQIQSVEDSIAAYREHHNMLVLDAPAHGVNGVHLTLTSRRTAFMRDSARRNGGRLVLREARDAMIQAGLFRDVRQYRQQIGRIIADMECWDRIRGQRGAYRLVFPNGQEH
jgi:hypothetical protein